MPGWLLPMLTNPTTGLMLLSALGYYGLSKIGEQRLERAKSARKGKSARAQSRALGMLVEQQMANQAVQRSYDKAAGISPGDLAYLQAYSGGPELPMDGGRSATTPQNDIMAALLEQQAPGMSGRILKGQLPDKYNPVL